MLHNYEQNAWYSSPNLIESFLSKNYYLQNLLLEETRISAAIAVYLYSYGKYCYLFDENSHRFCI